MADDRRIHVWVQAFKDREELVLQWHDPDTGKRRSKSAGTSHRGLAEMKATELAYELNHGLHQEASRMSWEKFRELFEAEYVSSCRANTRQNYRYALDHFEAICQPGRLGAITTRTVSAFAVGLRELPGRRRGSKMAPATVAVWLEFLRTALNWAREQKMITEAVKFPRVDVPETKPRPVAVEAFERLIEKAPDAQTRAYLLCGWLAGLRLHEAFLLEWDETDEAPYLDLAGRRIVLPARFAKGKRDQWVPLDPVLEEALAQLPRRGKCVFHFTTRRGQPISQKTMTGRIVRLAHKAGVKLTMHTLRKGFGCRHAGKVPAQVLQKLMRHRDIKTTMDYYANIDDAVMGAILGDNRQRNTSRNTEAPAPPPARDESPQTQEGQGA
jgi:integrase